MGCECNPFNTELNEEELKDFKMKIESEKLIEYLNETEKKEKVTLIEILKVPLFNCLPIQNIANLVRITGNTPHHVGLIIHTEGTNKNNETTEKLYIAQTYPITFASVKDMRKAFDAIIRYSPGAQDKTEVFISNEEYIPKEPGKLTIGEIREAVEKQPNKYHTFKYNCQHFVNRVIESLNLKKRYKEDDEYYYEHNLKNEEKEEKDENNEENQFKTGKFLVSYVLKQNQNGAMEAIKQDVVRMLNDERYDENEGNNQISANKGIDFDYDSEEYDEEEDKKVDRISELLGYAKLGRKIREDNKKINKDIQTMMKGSEKLKEEI